MERDPVEVILELAWDKWLGAEVSRREEAGEIGDEWTFYAAQLLFAKDVATVVLFNGEVMGTLIARKTNSDRQFEPGDPVDVNEDLVEIREWRIEWPEPVGFATFLRHRDRWLFFGNQWHNRDVIADHLSAAREFLQAARLGLAARNLRAFVDTLFSASELLNKALVLELPHEYQPKTSHGTIAAQFHLWSRQRGVDEKYVAIVKRLADLRTAARYLVRQFALSEDEAAAMLESAERFHDRLAEGAAEQARTVYSYPRPRARLTFFRSAARGLHVPAKLTPEPA